MPNYRHAARLAPVCVAFALLAAFGAVARASRAPRGAAPRTPAAQAPQTFVLTDFGAVGDGETDDGPALQAALDALAEAGGGTLLVPAGRYAIVTPAAKDFKGLASSVTIAGVASDTPVPPPSASGAELTRGLDLTSEFLPRTGESAAAIAVTGLAAFTVSDIAFVGTPGVETDAAVALYLFNVEEGERVRGVRLDAGRADEGDVFDGRASQAREDEHGPRTRARQELRLEVEPVR